MPLTNDADACTMKTDHAQLDKSPMKPKKLRRRSHLTKTTGIRKASKYFNHGLAAEVLSNSHEIAMRQEETKSFHFKRSLCTQYVEATR